MIRISKKIEYALMGLLYMARKNLNELTSAKELSQAYNIPPELMGKVLQNLARFEIIESVQGVKGGYRLRQPVNRIKLSDVIAAVDGPLKIVNCFKVQNSFECHQHFQCTIKNPMEFIQRKLTVFFNNVSLQDIENDMLVRSEPEQRQ
ncbi:MAG: Rrf2 family transcriptional regulator [bacterium]|nr:MAG: Rrf2 family transcriptional regulator [bacterium]